MLVTTVAAAWPVPGPGVRADATAVGGLPEAFGSTADGTGPGQLIPPGDPAALAAALGDWLGDEGHRHRLRAAVRQRQPTLRGWEQTTQEIANALTAHGRSEHVPPVVSNHPGETSGRACTTRAEQALGRALPVPAIRVKEKSVR